MRSVKVFIAYYDPSQEVHFSEVVSDIFLPWDVTFNKSSSLLELDLFRFILDSDDIWNEGDLVGVVSWKFLKKSQIPIDLLLNSIEKLRFSQKNALVINPAIANNALFANGFEQGAAVGHTYMSQLAQEMGFEKYVSALLSCKSFCASSYIIADKSFWEDLVFFLDKALSIGQQIAVNNANFSQRFYGSAGYHRNKNLDYQPFLVERFVQIFLESATKSYLHIPPNKTWFIQKFGQDIGQVLYNLYKLKEFASSNKFIFDQWQDLRRKILSDADLTSKILHLDDREIE